jgi:hypothetical protein
VIPHAGNRALVLCITLLATAGGLSCRGRIAERDLHQQLKTIWTVGADPAAGRPRFKLAAWAEPDPTGNLFVLDYDDQKISKLAPDGRLLGQFGGRGTGPGGLSKTRRFAWVDGRLYFANYGNERVEILGPEGEVFPSVALPDVKVPGEIYFTNQRFYIERRFVPDGHLLYAYDRDWKVQRRMVIADPKPDEAKFLRSHNTVCVAPDGLWVVYLLQNRIQKVGFDGKVLLETSRPLDWKFPKDDKGNVIPEILVHRACAVDPAGHLYVIYSNPEDWKRGNEAYEFSPDGRLLGKAFTLPVRAVSFIRFDPQGNFYYSNGVTLTKTRIERKAGGA